MCGLHSMLLILPSLFLTSADSCTRFLTVTYRNEAQKFRNGRLYDALNEEKTKPDVFSFSKSPPYQVKALDLSTPAENRNREILFEGDMKLNDNQKNSMASKSVQKSSRRRSRNTVRSLSKLWPDRLVRYQLATGMWDASKKKVRDALKGLQSKLGACVRFQEVDTGNRILVTWTNEGSSSMLGYQGNVQKLLLNTVWQGRLFFTLIVHICWFITFMKLPKIVLL